LEDNYVLKQIGQRIREVRLSKGMTQNDLAFEAHISPANISDIELGKSNIWISTFLKLIEALDISADYILRPDTPVAKEIYKKEFSHILSDCTPEEIESIMQIVKQVKTTLHTKKNEEDY